MRSVLVLKLNFPTVQILNDGYSPPLFLDRLTNYRCAAVPKRLQRCVQVLDRKTQSQRPVGFGLAFQEGVDFKDGTVEVGGVVPGAVAVLVVGEA